MLKTPWDLQLSLLDLKDGDIVVIRSDDPNVLQVADAYFAQENPRKVHFWLFRSEESIRVLTDEDKAMFRKHLDGEG